MLTYLEANPSCKAVVSGHPDPRGDKDCNEAHANNRAETVRDVLVGADVGESRFGMRKPQQTTGTGDNAEARRVVLTVESELNAVTLISVKIDWSFTGPFFRARRLQGGNHGVDRA